MITVIFLSWIEILYIITVCGVLDAVNFKEGNMLWSDKKKFSFMIKNVRGLWLGLIIKKISVLSN